MPRIVNETLIARAPSDVFALLTDFSQVSKVIPGIKESKILTQGPIAVGSRVRETRAVDGRERTAEYLVTRLETDRVFWMDVHQREKKQGEGGFELAPVPGGTHLTYTLEFALPWYLVFLTPVIRRVVHKEAVGDLEAIKAHLERQQRARLHVLERPCAPMPTDAEYRKRLSPQAYEVTRKGGTERAFTGAYWDHHEKGAYRCVCCSVPLFDSDSKFESGTGWPSYSQAAADAKLKEIVDTTHGMRRVEVRCASCDAHLGHVFEDGPRPTGLRYCINSAALEFDPETNQ